MKRFFAACGLASGLVCGGSLGAAHATGKRAALTASFIDRRIQAAWNHAQVRPAPRVDDAGFLRRIYLDLTGAIPPAEVVTAFLAERAPDKRARAVDRLLESPAYAAHFTDYWEKLLLGRGFAGQQVDRPAFREWLRSGLERNLPWSQVATELITALGVNSHGGELKVLAARAPASGVEETKVNGAVNWLLHYAQNGADLTGKVSRLFLGVQIQCAQCHDHPSEKWKQDDFRKLAAVFARMRPLPLEEKAKGSIRRIELTDSSAPFFFGEPNKPENQAIARAVPTALDGTDFGKSANRRQAFAAWLTAPGNPWFARSLVNRMWGHLLGRGFVEPLDDFRRSNRPAAPEVLDAVAADFSSHGYDLKRLIRLICSTRVYQLAATPAGAGGKAAGEKLWAHYRLRPLGPEELLASLDVATRFESALPLYAKKDVEKSKQQLHNLFTFLFDVDEEAGEPEYEGTIPQALMLLNSELANQATSAAPGLALADVLAMPVGDEQKIEALYLRMLSRRPRPAESKRWTAFVNAPREVVVSARRPPGKPANAAGQAKQQAYEDLFFALFNSSEFYYRH